MQTTLFNDYKSYKTPEENHINAFPVVAEIKLSYSPVIKACDRPKVSTSRDCELHFRKTWNPDTLELFEEFKIMYLNRGNRVLGIYPLSVGGITGTVADPRLILAAALLTSCSGLVLAHNHPSSNLTPSQSDIDLTKKIKNACKYHEIQLLDHMIITATSYFSFADSGIL